MKMRTRSGSVFFKDRILTGAACLVLLAASGSTTAAPYTAVDRYAMPGAGYDFRPISGAFGGQVVAGEVLWNANGSTTDLSVPGHLRTALYGTNGTHQFGEVGFLIAEEGRFVRHPAVWNGTAASATFLDQTGLFPLSRVHGAGGGQFVGIGNTIERGLTGNSALLWNSLTARVIDLNPTNLAGFHSTGAHGTSGTQQVGSGFTSSDGDGTHALLWTGSADSAVDLHPRSLLPIHSSNAVATDGLQQVGSGATQDTYHALLWAGTAGSVVDLHPSGFAGSAAAAVANGKQAGYGYVSEDSVPWNALLWSGTADSAVNLHQFLPADFNQSRAYGIDDAGHVFGVAFNSSDQQWHAIEWVPQVVPEPASLGLLIPLAAVALQRRRPLHARRAPPQAAGPQ